MSFTDIVARLDLSKGSVSMGLRVLRAVGTIHPAEGTDWRCEHFLAEVDLRALIGGLLRESIQPQIKAGLRRIERMRIRHRALFGSRTGDSRLLL